MTERTLGLIPARGGSKGIPRKNIKLLGGRPLIEWTIEAALQARSLAAVVVSTDDDEIAAVARRAGADVPFVRPERLARDDTPGVDLVLHALEELPEFDAVVMLQPTSPFRSAADVDACTALAQRLHAPAAVSVTAPAKHPYWMYRLDERQRLQPLLDTPLIPRRQDLPKVYALNGALYYAEASWLRQTRSFISTDTIAYVMPPERSHDLDLPTDWRVAEFLLSRGA